MRDELDEMDEVLERAANGEDDLGILLTRARAIRDRERKLAELARERYELLRHFVAENVATTEERTELRRYENAIK